MTWSLLETGSFVWPNELDPDRYKKLDTSPAFKELMKKLEGVATAFRRIDFPYQWITSNPVTHLNWQNHALAFMAGPAKALRYNMTSLHDLAQDTVGKAGTPKGKDAAKAIAKAAKLHMALVDPKVLDTDIQLVNKLCGTAQEEEAKKKTGSVKKACKALVATRHKTIVDAQEMLVKSRKKDDEGPDLEAIARVVSDGSAAIVDLASQLIRLQKTRKMMVKGLDESDYGMLGRVKTALKDYAAGSAWTKGHDIKAMADGINSVRRQTTYFDQVVRRMKSK